MSFSFFFPHMHYLHMTCVLTGLVGASFGAMLCTQCRGGSSLGATVEVTIGFRIAVWWSQTARPVGALSKHVPQADPTANPNPAA